MNNGVNNNSVNDGPTLAPMEGVKIAPAMEGPVNASVKAQQAQSPAVPIITATQPVNENGGQNITQQNNNVSFTQTNQVQQNIKPAPPTVTPQPTPEKPVVQPLPTLETNQSSISNNDKKTKNQINLTPILIGIIIILGIGIFYISHSNKQQISQLKYNCTPVGASSEEKELDVNSTLVENLYNKVSTSIREDLAQPEFNDEMKLYLAYRQILETEKYDSNCNLFSVTAMEPYRCEVSTNFAPKAFKVETIQRKIKELFGEETNIPLKNIQLGKSCVVGYQYIEKRGEFVEGTCNQKTATSFKAIKTLSKAITTRNTIILTEDVKYQETEGLTLPSYLKSGTYKYVFRLDQNYNYVLVSKTFESKY